MAQDVVSVWVGRETGFQPLQLLSWTHIQCPAKHFQLQVTQAVLPPPSPPPVHPV
jgi:hypothetical protein